MTTKGFANIAEILEPNVSRINHLLVIAIDDYVHCPKLNNAVKDVQDFIGLMTEKFEFEKENIRFLHNEMATKSNIFKRLHELATHLKPSDNLVIYFSGHGEYDNILNRGYWIPVEAQKGDFSYYISNTDVKDYLSAIKTHHTFLIADSCFSGTLFTQSTKDVSERLEKNPSRWGLTSGRNEIVSDGKLGENSPFAASLLYHLQQITEPIGVQELCHVVLETTAANANQTPLGEPLQVEGHKSGQFVFRLKRNIDKAWENALKINTVEAFLEYEENYPDSPHISEIDAKIKEIEETEEWVNATVLNKISTYRQYKKHYPNGQYTALANEAIKVLSQRKTEILFEKETIEDDFFKNQMVKIKGGIFQMGSDLSDKEQPIHEVNIFDFQLSKYPVTQKQWQEIMGTTVENQRDKADKTWAIYGASDDYPMYYVSWEEAQQFLKRLNRKTNKKYRLPTEAEWEFAARGGNLSQGYDFAGSNDIRAVAWFNSNQSHAVGWKMPNELGLYDMSGNVWEWCEDAWHDNYRNAPNDGTAWLDGGDTNRRLSRGGAWSTDSDFCRVSFRNWYFPLGRSAAIGFRVAHD